MVGLKWLNTSPTQIFASSVEYLVLDGFPDHQLKHRHKNFCRIFVVKELNTSSKWKCSKDISDLLCLKFDEPVWPAGVNGFLHVPADLTAFDHRTHSWGRSQAEECGPEYPGCIWYRSGSLVLAGSRCWRRRSGMKDTPLGSLRNRAERSPRSKGSVGCSFLDSNASGQ